MDRAALFVIALMLLFSTVSAVTVVLTADKKELKINETITIHLEVREAGRVGGQLMIYRENDSNRFDAVGKPRFASQCTMCKGGSDLGDINEESAYIPLHDGRYKAVANYGGVSREVNFTVYPITTTTTTSTTTTTRKPTTTTSTTTTSITTTSTTTTTSTSTTTTSVPENYGRRSMMTLYLFGALLVLSILFFTYLRNR